MADSLSLSSHQALLSSILSYLSSLKQSPLASTLLVSVDSLDAALECLIEATGLPSPATPAPPVSAGVGAVPRLVDVYQAGLSALASSSVSSTPSTSSSSHFAQFVDLLSARGFFAGVESGSPAYEERLKAAKQKYDDKYEAASTDTGATTQSAAAATSFIPSSSDRVQAEQLKAEGNAYLSSHEYDKAVQRYTAAIALNPQSAIYYGNRAAAHINMSHWTDAETDCRQAIQIDPTYGKAHYRLGQSLLSQGRAGDAIVSFEAALRHTDASMRSTIDEQLTAARRQAAKADGSGAGTELDTDEMDSGGDEGGGGSMGGFDFASLLSNPMVAQMAAQLAGGAGGEGGAGGGLNFNSLLSNPQLMQMAASMFGGGGGGGGGGSSSRPAASRSPAGASSSPSLPSLQAFLESPAAASLASDPDLGPVIADVRANGQSALGRHLSNPKLLSKLTSLAASMNSNTGTDNSR